MDNRTAIIKQPDNISSFNDVYKLQKEYQEALILDNSNPDFIWIGEHQLCYTLGRGSNYDNLLFSLNGVDEVYNWIRGGDFKKTVENAEKIYYECGHKIQPTTTITIYNFFSLIKIVDYFNDKSYVKWQHCYNVVDWPNWASVIHFPENIFDKAMSDNKNVLPNYKNVNYANLFKVENKYDKKIIDTAKKYTETMNDIRGFNITDYVPELKKLFNH